MRNGKSLRKYAILGGVLLTLVGLVVALAFIAAWKETALDTGDSLVGGRSTVGTGAVRALLSAAGEGRSCAIVEFRSEEMRTAGGERLPETAFWPTDLGGTGELRIKGSFHVLCDLNLRFPRWGHVEDAFDVRTRWGGDPAYKRLRVLLYAAKQAGPSCLIAINAPRSKAPREAEFLGPLTPGDVIWVPEMFKILRESGYNSITVEEAKSFVMAKNPWIAWLGLLRLDDFKLLDVDHFALALQYRAADDVEGVIWEMLRLAEDNKALRLGMQSKMLFQSLEPEKQARALQALLHYYEGTPRGDHPYIDRFVDVRKLREQANAYRQSIASDPERQRIVPYLEAIGRLE